MGTRWPQARTRACVGVRAAANLEDALQHSAHARAPDEPEPELTNLVTITPVNHHDFGSCHLALAIVLVAESFLQLATMRAANFLTPATQLQRERAGLSGALRLSSGRAYDWLDIWAPFLLAAGAECPLEPVIVCSLANLADCLSPTCCWRLFGHA